MWSNYFRKETNLKEIKYIHYEKKGNVNMAVNNIKEKRENISDKLKGIEEKVIQLEYFLEKFAEINKCYVDRTVFLEKSFCELMEKNSRIEAFSINAMMDGMRSVNRLDYIERKLLDVAILDKESLADSKSNTEDECRALEDHLIKEGV
jgi:hypothetical protein